MPASLFGDMDQHHGPNGLEDQRALQLALELSMLCDPLTLSSHDSGHSSDSTFFSSNDDLRMIPKKSQNMTECVPVPSSEHVAEIVGRQGCKIKALRAKTNTYIKTPVRGEEPVFVVTGRKEDVTLAKREILSAAEHFSQIRASRKGGAGTGSGTAGLTCAPAPVPGQITIQVRVPYRVVGLVVGPKGATIKRIQQQTHTYIVTPSRDKDPVFEVTGLPDNVQMAKREIESHILIRTGSVPLEGHHGDLSSELHALRSGSLSLEGHNGEELSSGHSELLATLYKNGINGLVDGLGGLGFGLEELGLFGLNTINSLSSSLSSVSGVGLVGGAFESNSGNSGSVGSSTSGGGSLSSLSDLNGFSSTTKNNVANNKTPSLSNNVYGHNMTEPTFHLFETDPI